MTIKNLAKVYSAELEGIDAKLVEVEIDLNVGLHSFNIVGLADRALNEARERVNSAIKNSGAKPPNRENRRITINLAPADIKKTGSHYDLAIALGYLLATKQMKPFATADKLFIGELALDGGLRAIDGALNIAEMAKTLGFNYIFLPKHNAGEAAAIAGMTVVPLENLAHAVAVLEGGKIIQTAADAAPDSSEESTSDFSEIINQENAKRAFTIAAAGGHNLLMIGPPGVGKTMLARALVGILPKPSREEAIEITKIWSAAGLSTGKLMQNRPFRSPHQSASAAALVGGGGDPKPGEISLAHRGVLFLDELPEFHERALESLREPLESGMVRIARAKQSLVFPAKFTLIAAMNPCPCGYYGDAELACTCTAYEIIKYRKRISGPLLDRIDLQIKIGRVKIADLREGKGMPAANAVMREKIQKTRVVQAERFRRLPIFTNAEMTSRETQAMIALDGRAERFLETFDHSRLSPRAYYRILKVARTIADLEGRENVSAEHLAEAFSYRLREER